MVANLTSFATLDYREYVASVSLNQAALAPPPGRLRQESCHPAYRSPQSRRRLILTRQPVDIIHLPERLAGSGRPGIWRRIEEARRVFPKPRTAHFPQTALDDCRSMSLCIAELGSRLDRYGSIAGDCQCLNTAIPVIDYCAS